MPTATGSFSNSVLFGSFSVATSSSMELVDVTEQARQAVQTSRTEDGILILFSPHTTAGLTINEGCDPAVRHDLLAIFRQLAPPSVHHLHAEGNSPAHALTTLTGSSLTMIIARGSLQLGRWQRIFFCEYDGPRSRTVLWKAMPG